MATLSTTERRAINLTWAPPFDGNSPLLRYVLEMSENSKGARAGATPVSPTHPGSSTTRACTARRGARSSGQTQGARMRVSAQGA